MISLIPVQRGKNINCRKARKDLMNIYHSRQHESTFLYAAISGNVRKLQCLILNHNLNINITALEGETALHLAAMRNNIDIVKVLLNQPNINVNIKDIEGATPLSNAVFSNNGIIITLFLSIQTMDLTNDYLFWDVAIRYKAWTSIMTIMQYASDSQNKYSNIINDRIMNCQLYSSLCITDLMKLKSLWGLYFWNPNPKNPVNNDSIFSNIRYRTLPADFQVLCNQILLLSVCQSSISSLPTDVIENIVGFVGRDMEIH